MNQQSKHIESKIISEQPAFEGKWLGLKYTNYSIGEKVIKNYETVYRTTTKNSGRDIDGVEIIPVIKYKDENKCNEVVMIANFRPPLGKFSLQFPSGLLENENYEQNARREVLQETGYLIKRFIQLPYPPMHCDPWKSNESGLFYLGVIDGDDPNSHKAQQLENDQNINVHVLPLDENLMDKIYKLAQENNYGVEAKIWSISIGLRLLQLLKE